MTELLMKSSLEPTDGRPIRDMSDEEFQRRYDCDRFTATVLTNRFRHVVQHIGTQLRVRAFSPIIRDSADLCAMLSGPASLGFPMAAVSESLPLFFGSIPDAVRIVLEEYGVDRVKPGDVILVNDYYRVGTHLNDACLIRPLFYGDELIGAVTLRAHMMDMGGVIMYGFGGVKYNTWQDGLRLPPTLLYAAGEPVASTFNLLYDNTRLGHLIIPDLKTASLALELGERLLVETVEKYGFAAYCGAMRYACDASDEAMRDSLRAIPDGIYEGEEGIDGDGLPDSDEYRVRVRITKVGPRAEIDLRGTSPATRGSVNCTWVDIKTAVAIALKCLVDHKHSMTSGTLRAIDIVVPPDAICNPDPPHACQYYHEVVMTIVNAIYRALNPVLGPDAVGSSALTVGHFPEGQYPDGTEWNALSEMPNMCGPWGATRHGDGDSSQQPIFQNSVMSGGLESYEMDHPLIVLGSEYMPDGGGAGEHRGGAANAHDVMCRLPAEHRFEQFHGRRPIGGGGVNGGKPGALCAFWLWDGAESEPSDSETRFIPLSLKDPVYGESIPKSGMFNPSTNAPDPDGEYVFVSSPTSARAGAIVRLVTSGGGGWGNPFARDPERVLIDVRDEYVTVEGAARDYGVVIVGDPVTHPEALAIDDDATALLRADDAASGAG